jgi:DNA invertase Pin-like site-specific DNA recombinase
MEKVFGYARVSTKDQNMERQLSSLNAYGVDEIYQEKVSGTKKDREQLNALLSQLRTGDTVVVAELSRLARSTKQLYDLVDMFDTKGVNFVSLKENIDTSTATGKLIFNIFSALSQFERDLISERTREGLAAANRKGNKGGRPRTDARTIETALKMYDSGSHTIKQICEVTNIGRTTLYDHLRGRKG